jgi:dTDP-4-dehydrorhamnose reductase
MNVVIIGANGQLGTDLMRIFADVNPKGLTHSDIEISDDRSVTSVLFSIQPELIINTAAYHKVEECEKNPGRSFEVNAVGAMNLARAADMLKSELLHISTDYVFDGKKRVPYRETDLPHPLNTYAVTKLAGEHYIQAHCPRYYVVRSSGLYGHNLCRAKGGSFIDKMLTLAKERKEVRVVRDEILTPTYTFHLAQQIRELVETHSYGVYHITNNGFCSWYEFAQEIFRLAGIAVAVTPTTSKEFASPVKRPGYSVLENAALQTLGIDHMPDWKESLAHYFRNKPSSV